MLDVLQLNAAEAAAGLSGAEVARRTGMKPKTYYRKKKNDSFTTRDAEKIGYVLNLPNLEIFFAHCVS